MHKNPILLCRPKSDTCKTCDELRIQIEAATDETIKAQRKGELMLHQTKAERAYQQLKEDMALAKSDPTVAMITFDLEQTLPTPSISTNIVFYKRQLWTYNLGIHEGESGRACMHMWHEGVAGRGSCEIGSCILRHLEEMFKNGRMKPETTTLITYSDSCGGQNRNIYLVLLWLHIVSCMYLPIRVVEQKFMISGHSYLPNDRDFGSIECAKRRHQSIYIPDEWYSLVEHARRKNPFSVHVMNRKDFVALKSLKPNIVNRKWNNDHCKVNWLAMHWIRVSSEKPYQFSYKYSLNELESWKVVDLRRKRGRPASMARPIPLLYTAPRKIKQRKLDDLHSLLPYLPPVHHAFYESLSGSVDQCSEESEQSDTE